MNDFQLPGATPPKAAILFPGQGSQTVGMGTAFCNTNNQAVAIFKIASDILGYDLLELCKNGSLEDLSESAVAQPAIMAASLVSFEAVISRNAGDICVAVAGHSLGQFAAMVAAEMVSMEDGFKMIKARAEAMAACAGKTPGAMAAIVGLDSQQVENACLLVCPDPQAVTLPTDYVVPANYNAPAQTVISGTLSGVEKAGTLLAEKGAKVIRLNVASGFHSRLMTAAAEQFAAFLDKNNIVITSPSVDFYSNISGKLLKDFTAVKSLLSAHIVSPVRFTDMVENMVSHSGCDTFIECGPGKVLSGLVKKISKPLKAFSVNDPASLEKLVAVIPGI